MTGRKPRLLFDLMTLLTMICLFIRTIRKRREEKSIDRSERRTGWLWYLLLIGYVLLLARNFEPLKTINETHSAQGYLLMLVFFISGAAWLTLALREGKAIRREKETASQRRGEWWKQKWYWIVCILLPLVLVPITNLLFFPETPLSRSVVYAVAGSIGVFSAYFAYMGKRVLKIQPKTLRRIIFIAFGACCVGTLSWAFIVLPLASYLSIPGPIVILLLFVSMTVSAFTVDTIMKRREYRPIIEGGGNI